MLKPGDQVGLIACSDGRPISMKPRIEELIKFLSQCGLTVNLADTLYQKDNIPFSGTPKERGQALMSLFGDQKVKAIFDVSGGDSANQVLPYLNNHLIKQNFKPFFGHSDLSVLLNGIFQQTGLETYHYQILHLIGKHAVEQQNRFRKLMFEGDNERFDYEWIRGNKMNGVVVGGNIRCFLKLAGTSYLPDPDGKILFLESLGGGLNRTASLLTQLDLMGYFERCAGLILGTFTELEKKVEKKVLTDLVSEMTEKHRLPIVTTNQLGHGSDSRCLMIGRKLELMKD